MNLHEWNECFSAYTIKFSPLRSWSYGRIQAWHGPRWWWGSRKVWRQVYFFASQSLSPHLLYGWTPPGSTRLIYRACGTPEWRRREGPVISTASMTQHLCANPIYLTWYNNRPSPWVRSTSSQNAANRETSPGKPLAKGAGKRYCSFSLTDWNWTSPLSENWCKGREEGNCDTYLINL